MTIIIIVLLYMDFIFYTNNYLCKIIMIIVLFLLSKICYNFKI